MIKRLILALLLSGSPLWATLSIADNASGSPQTVSLTGTGTAVVASLSPRSLTFGSESLHTASSPQVVTLHNTGSAVLKIARIGFSGADTTDFTQVDTCGASVAAGNTCTIVVLFTPSAIGTPVASLSITDNASGGPQRVSLTGAGAMAVASLSPSSLTFGNESVGTSSSSQVVTLKNTGNAALSLTRIAVTGADASDFTQDDNCGASVPARGACTIAVLFTPSVAGARAALLKITDTAGGSPQAVSLSGTGTQTLVWSDEFDLPDGSAPDPSKWNYDLGGWGWGNQELECYTNSRQNAFIQGGKLVIQALNAPNTVCKDRNNNTTVNNYTSARLNTAGKFGQAYGRFEARIKIPYGQGMWPAFWLVGNNIGSVGSAAAGEIDIMENIGKEPSIIHGSMHGPGTNGGINSQSAAFALPNGERFSGDFHVFAIEWGASRVRLYVDNNLYETVNQSDVTAGGPWVFDHPFFIILNVAVGGTWPGGPDATTVFPQQMLVDYVRVYQ
jgi:beta-glucanase (GH16 family)